MAAASSAPTGDSQRTQFEFVNGREQKLQGVEYLPASGRRWASLVWNHGVCEHCERYVPVFEHLAAAGVAVYSFDVHGHGRSEPLTPEGDRGLVQRYTDLVDDLYTFVGVVEQRVGGRLPAESSFLGGQSMGGLVAALGALRCQERWAGLVVFSGAMGVVWTLVLRVQAALGNIMASLIPRAQLVPAVDPDHLHPDPAVVKAFREDPLVFKGDLRARTGNELLKAIRYLEAHRGELVLPIYTVHGTRDAVTSVDAIEAFVGGVSSADKTLSKVEGGYHEMLMGREATASADGMIAWMRARAGGKGWAQEQAQEQGGGGGGGGAAAAVAEGPAGPPKL